MTDSKSDITSGFVRQRRSLIITSLLLLAFQHTGATIETLNVFGNSIDFPRGPVALVAPIWVAWFYFLIRYYQYMRDLPGGEFTTKYSQRLQKLIEAAAVTKLKATYDAPTAEMENPGRPEYNIEQVHVSKTSSDTWAAHFKGDVTVRQTSPSKYWNQELPDSKLVHLPDSELLWERNRARLWVCLHTRLVTEYALPFVIAAAPLVVLVVGIL